jgi:hypothetical protein
MLCLDYFNRFAKQKNWGALLFTQSRTGPSLALNLFKAVLATTSLCSSLIWKFIFYSAFSQVQSRARHGGRTIPFSAVLNGNDALGKCGECLFRRQDRGPQADRLTAQNWGVQAGQPRESRFRNHEKTRVLCEILTVLGLVAPGTVAWHVEGLQGKPVFLLTCSAIGEVAPMGAASS